MCAAVATILSGASGLARAQQIVIDADDEPTPSAFGLALADQKVRDLHADFRRYCKRGRWEKAFRSLAQIADSDPQGLAADAGDFWLSLRQLVWDDLVELGPDGKRAFRVFDTAAAERMYEEAVRAGRGGDPEELQLLAKLFDFHFISSVGDQAADRLGDIAFEAGRFASAARYWREILQHCPDTDLSRVRLRVKLATALARAGASRELGRVREILQERFANETLTVSGREMRVGEYLELLPRLEVDGPQGPPPEPALELPATDTPAWQMEFIGPSMRSALKAASQQNGWGPWQVGLRAAGLGAVVPPSAVSDGRVYVNWLGICFALDLDTGKLLWRTSKFSKHKETFETEGYWFAIGRHAIAADRDHVLTVGARLSASNNNPNSNQPIDPLTCLDARTGERKWRSRSVNGIKKLNFTCAPLIVDDVVYATAKAPEAKLMLVALSLEHGELHWTLELGTGASGGNNMNPWGVAQQTESSLVHDDGRIFVLTNSGAVIAVDLARQMIEWAFTYELPPSPPQQFGWQFGGGRGLSQAPSGWLHDGVLYFRDVRSARLYGLDVAKRAVTYTRPVAPGEALAGRDEGALYVLGSELSAIDPVSGALRWNTQIPVATDNMRLLLSDRQLFIFGPRGIFQISKQNGDVERIFRGADLSSLGGTVLRVGQRLICVSNQAVTAYDCSLNTPGGSERSTHSPGGGN